MNKKSLIIFLTNKGVDSSNLYENTLKKGVAIRFGISRERLRLPLKEIKGLDMGRRQLLYTYEVRLIFKEFEVEE